MQADDLIDTIQRAKQKIAEYGPAIECIYLGQRQKRELELYLSTLLTQRNMDPTSPPRINGVPIYFVEAQDHVRIIWRDSVSNQLYIKQ